jgi:hypothetical protein
MVKSDNMILEQSIQSFRERYGAGFETMIHLLNAAGISHYSSGCGTKSVTFDIFPASQTVKEMLSMLSLDRPFKKKGVGLRDARDTYNPANEFMQYMRRWMGFVEQVMKHEGDSARGIAAAQAKLVMDNLMQQLCEGKPIGSKLTEFAKLMENIARILLANAQNNVDHTKTVRKTHQDHNYRKALMMAQSGGAWPPGSPQAA